MKKILYFFPVTLGFIIYLYLGITSSFYSINSFVWLSLSLLLISGLLMYKNKWWGSVLGILMGVLLIYMGSRETGQIIKETPFGIVICIYYIFCATVSYKKK